jgi:hypothetical protein
MPKRNNPLGIDEQRIINSLEANVIEADTIQGGEISEQRQRNHIYYGLEPVGPIQKGRSDYTSADVLDSVESQKAFYLEAYASGRSVVQFLPEDDRDQDNGLATKYVERQFWDYNEGYQLLRDGLHDAFVAKRMVVKVDWEERKSTVQREFQGASPVQIPGLQQRGNITSIQQAAQGFSGTLEEEQDQGKVCVDLIQPERFFRDPNATYIKESMFCGYQEDIARHDLVSEGFKEEEIAELNLDYRFRQNEEDAARKDHDSTWSRARRHKRSPEQELVTVYHSWAYLDLSQFLPSNTETNIAGTRLYHFVWSQGELLTLPGMDQKWEEVDQYPFLEWVQYKISHAEHGLCEADVEATVQWTKSALSRLIIDNQASVNTTRWKAKSGFIKNPRELLDNKIGSVLWVKSMENSLEPLPTPPLSPVSFSVLEMLDIEKENRNGLSRLAKGLSGDAISHQNADNMIERLTNASNRRVLRGVRDFAESFLKPLFIRIYELGAKNDQRIHLLQSQGQNVQMGPQQRRIKQRTLMNVNVATAPDQGREQAMFMLQLHSMMSQDEQLRSVYSLPQKVALIDDVMDLMALPENYKYLAQLDSPQVQQAQQMSKQMQQMAKQMQAMQAQLDKSDDDRKWAETRVKQGKLQLDVADTEADNLRADAELQLDRERAAAEYEIEKQQQRGAEI